MKKNLVTKKHHINKITKINHLILISILLSLNYGIINPIFLRENGQVKPVIILNEIGKGSYSHVYDGFIVNELKPCVIKVLKSGDKYKYEREITIMNKLKDGPNIITVCFL